MTNKLDVLALSEEVEHDSNSGKLCQELLSQGQTLYGKSANYPEYIERITPDGKKALGHWINGEFVVAINLY
ncbi:hypothetical protein [Arsukibacterium sp.]|uniref:hypothetical protein n=1 Tax=Arsukibacterium sp. TaxID=1977258 RepID=UPI001BD6BBF8|nr:hypothetical protein [Arsukibacterium sp.]